MTININPDEEQLEDIVKKSYRSYRKNKRRGSCSRWIYKTWIYRSRESLYSDVFRN